MTVNPQKNRSTHTARADAGLTAGRRPSEDSPRPCGARMGERGAGSPPFPTGRAGCELPGGRAPAAQLCPGPHRVEGGRRDNADLGTALCRAEPRVSARPRLKGSRLSRRGRQEVACKGDFQHGAEGIKPILTITVVCGVEKLERCWRSLGNRLKMFIP